MCAPLPFINEALVHLPEVASTQAIAQCQVRAAPLRSMTLAVQLARSTLPASGRKHMTLLVH